MRTPIAALEGCCLPKLKSRLAKPDARQLAAAFKAIADPARLRVISLIASRASGEACVCDLIKPLGLSQPTVSHHLKILYDAGVLDRERRGTWMFYRIVAERLAALRDALAMPDGLEGPASGGE